MKKLTASFLLTGILIFLIAGNIGGCNDTPCDFDLNSLFNGSSIVDQDSEWDCKVGGETIFTMALFSDLTGVRSDIGIFDFDRPECRTLNFENEQGSGKYKNLEGSVTIGLINFNQVSDDFGDLAIVCDYVEF